jgi:membrane-associated phospholipid phosphatase
VTAGCLLLALLTWIGAFHVGVVQDADAALLRALVAVDDADTPLEPFTDGLLELMRPLLYACACLLVLGVGWRLAGARRTIVAAAVLAGANVTTQVLKPLLAEPRFHESLARQIGAESWPRGNTTAAFALAAAAVLVAPPASRVVVGIVTGMLALAVGFAVVANHWHYPSDVLGGIAVTGAWASAAGYVSSRRPAPAATAARRRRWLRATG